MSVRNEVQQAYDLASKGAGYVKHSGSWYKRLPETIAVLNLQKSQYGPKYYVNLALWLLPLGEATYPKVAECHLFARIEKLVPQTLHSRLTTLLDLEKDVEGPTRLTELQGFIAHAAEEFSSFPTIRSLVTGEGKDFLAWVSISGWAPQLLETAASQSE